MKYFKIMHTGFGTSPYTEVRNIMDVLYMNAPEISTRKFKKPLTLVKGL